MTDQIELAPDEYRFKLDTPDHDLTVGAQFASDDRMFQVTRVSDDRLTIEARRLEEVSP